MGKTKKTHSFSRRALLTGIVATAGGAAGLALGYKYRANIRAVELLARGRPLQPPLGLGQFRQEATTIFEQHRQQTVATVAQLKRKYESIVFGKVRVWDLIEKLALCIDPTDMRLYAASQFVHIQQILASMEQNGIDDPNMLITAIIHDLGKVLLLTGELPENIVCGARRIGEYEKGIGLDNVVYQFGHGEFIYSRMKDHVPDHVAWAVRYHNINLEDAMPYMKAHEREYADKFLRPFQKFDGSFGSPYFCPKVNIGRYRDLIEEYFPQPILF